MAYMTTHHTSRFISALALAVGIVMASSGCAYTSADRRPEYGQFRADGFDITFQYPATMRLTEDVAAQRNAGAPPSADDKIVALELDNDNLIGIQRIALRHPVTIENLAAVKPEADAVVGSLDPNAQPGVPEMVGGFPSLEYQITTGAKQSRYVMVFDNAVEYVLNFQFTPHHHQDIIDASNVVLHSLRRA